MIINSLNMRDEDGDRYSIRFRALGELTATFGKLFDDYSISSGKSHFECELLGHSFHNFGPVNAKLFLKKLVEFPVGHGFP